MDNLSLHKAIGTELRVIAESLATIGTLLERIGSTGDSESLAVSESQTNQPEKGVRDRAGRANALTMYHLEMKPKIEEENRGLSAMDIYRKIVDMWKMLTAPEKTKYTEKAAQYNQMKFPNFIGKKNKRKQNNEKEEPKIEQSEEKETEDVAVETPQDDEIPTEKKPKKHRSKSKKVSSVLKDDADIHSASKETLPVPIPSTDTSMLEEKKGDIENPKKHKSKSKKSLSQPAAGVDYEKDDEIINKILFERSDREPKKKSKKKDEFDSE